MSRVIFHFTVDTQLRLLLVSNLPAHSPALHLLRCRLALAFFFDDPSCLCNVAPSLVVVINRLSEPPFQIREGMDFAQLAAQISMVDIGVDHVISSTSAYTEQREATFNRDVDSLATRVKTMFTSIIDSGASHMTRTEAKEVLEALHYRLMYAVRTKIKPKLSLFGSANPSKYNEDQKVGSFMINFLSKGRSNDESGCR